MQAPDYVVGCYAAPQAATMADSDSDHPAQLHLILTTPTPIEIKITDTDTDLRELPSLPYLKLTPETVERLAPSLKVCF